MKTSIVWFKTDLRLHDNETLVRAVAESDQVIPFYCIDERQFRLSEFGFKKTGNLRTQFLFEALTDLHKELKKAGSSLVIAVGKPEIELPRLAKEFNATRVFAKKEVAHEELEVMSAVENELWKVRCTLETFSTSTLHLATDLPFSIKDIPDIFTNYRTKVEKEATVRNVFARPEKINSPQLPLFLLPAFEDLDLEAPDKDQRSAFPFKGGESEALKRIAYYFHESRLISNYKETRNGLIGADYSSKFSPWLALGCISAREIYMELKKYEAEHGGNDSTYWMYFELLWRDYFRFMMKKYHTKYFQKYGIKSSGDNSGAPLDKGKLLAWVNGQTGVDFIDANMKELKYSGYMSNRGRQVVASYFCNDLKVDWRYGAAYFEQQLIDYDVCSNWGNWAYMAGVGNDPRKDRYFNVAKQAETFDKNGAYQRLWLTH